MEVLLGIGVFGLFMLAVGLVMISGQENTIVGGDRIRAAFLVQRALDGTRAIRDASFSSVTVGPHGVNVNGAGKWEFTGTESTTTGGYITSVTVSSLASNWLSVTAQSKWKHGYNRSGSVLVTAELTDWRPSSNIGNWSSITLEGSYAQAGSPNFTDVLVTGNHALVAASDQSTNANGLYLYDVTDRANPVRVNSSFSLGVDVYALAVRGKMLYLLTADPSAEVKAYSITSLPTLTLRTTYNLPGSGLGRSIGVLGNLLYVGSSYSAAAGENELYSFDIRSSGSIVLKSGMDDAGYYNDIALSGTAAYIGVDLDTSELRVATIQSSGSIALAPGQGMNVTGTEDGLQVAVTATAALLGRSRGTGIQEMTLFELPVSGGLPTSGGPWFHEMSGSVVGLAADPTGCYAFAATRQNWKALQILKMGDYSLSEVSSYTPSSLAGKGLSYDLPNDRLYFLSDSTLFIFRPAAGTGSC